MDNTQRTKLCNRIITGYQPVIFQHKIYYVKDPITQDNFLADFYCDNLYQDLFEDGVLTEKESLEILKQKKIWTDENEKELELLIKDHTRVYKELRNCQFKSKEKKVWEETLKANKKRVKELTELKNSLAFQTVEYMVRIEKYKYLIFLNTLDSNYNRLWTDINVFENSENEKIINHLLKKSYLGFSIDTSTIRELARTDPWRIMWRTAIKTGKLFDKPSSEMTEYQIELVSWSMLYDSVYESMDCPTDDVINNDDLLDGWLIDQQEKRKKERNEQISSGNEKIDNSSEVGIVVDSFEDAKKVFDLNSEASKARIKARERALQKVGRIQEQELPDIKRELELQYNNMVVEKHRPK